MIEASIGMQDAISRAIDFLDRDARDSDLEDGGDAEPSLGAVNPTFPDYPHAPAAACARGLTQAHWADGAADDREAEHDGREPDDDEV